MSSKHESKDFKATVMLHDGETTVDVVDYNGTMAICAREDGPILITKEQAMKFFNLQERHYECQYD